MSSSEVTDDEYTVLMIMQQGQSLAAIARWEKPLDALVERGLARRLDKFNNIITAEGRKACSAREAGDTAAAKALMPQIATAMDIAQQNVQRAAECLVVAVRNSPTDDAPETALIMWNVEVLKRARELLRD